MSVALTGLDEVVAEFRAELRALHEKVDALSAWAGHDEGGWYDLERAANYLSLSKGALDRAVRRGTVDLSAQPTA
jgi:hypothetical protein